VACRYYWHGPSKSSGVLRITSFPANVLVFDITLGDGAGSGVAFHIIRCEDTTVLNNVTSNLIIVTMAESLQIIPANFVLNEVEILVDNPPPTPSLTPTKTQTPVGQPVPISAEFRVNAHKTDRQSYPAMAMDTTGNCVISWQSSGQVGDGSGVLAKGFNALTTGIRYFPTPVGPKLQVNSYTKNFQGRPVMAMSSTEGGQGNTAIGPWSTVAGGYSNTPSGVYSRVAGGVSNTASGDYSFAAGRRAKATHQG